MASDASHMLEAALEQMDDIIAGKTHIADMKSSWFFQIAMNWSTIIYPLLNNKQDILKACLSKMGRVKVIL